MRILILSNLYPPDFIGGYELCCAQVAEGLLDRGHDLKVLTSSPRTPCPTQGHVSRLLELTNCYDPFSVSHCQPHTRQLWDARANLVCAHNVQVLNSVCEEFQPDVVYLWNLVGLGGLGLVACLQHVGMPWVWYLGDCVPRLLCSLGERVMPAVADEFSRQIRGYYMPVSERVVTEIETGGVRLEGQIEVMPNWIRGQRPAPRTRYFAPGETLRIVSAGQMGWHKGIDILIEAAALLKARGHRDFCIDLFGKVTDPALPALASQRQVEDCVRFLGQCPQADLVERYESQEYDIFAFPTWSREPFGCAPLEAAAYGCLMLMSQSCGIAEWFVDDVHCLKRPRTAEAFADAIEHILTGAIELAPLARRGADCIWRNFHLDALLPRIEEVMVEAAGQELVAAGTPAEAYRLALLGEKLAQAFIHQQAEARAHAWAA